MYVDIFYREYLCYTKLSFTTQISMNVAQGKVYAIIILAALTLRAVTSVLVTMDSLEMDLTALVSS